MKLLYFADNLSKKLNNTHQVHLFSRGWLSSWVYELQSGDPCSNPNYNIQCKYGLIELYMVCITIKNDLIE